MLKATVRAALFLAHHKPLKAVAALEPARPYELSSFHVLIERGEAYLQANQPKLAVAELRKALDHLQHRCHCTRNSPRTPRPGARLRADGDAAASRTEYQQLFAIWTDANPDLPVMVQARAEYARLEK